MKHAWGRGEVFAGFWLGGPKVRDHCENLGVVERITLRWGELGKARSGYGVAVGFCEHGNEPSSSIKKAGYPLFS
jgi:hypothetical protein